MSCNLYQARDGSSSLSNLTKSLLCVCVFFVFCFFIFSFKGGTSGDSVTQTEGVVILPEKASLTLKCTYQSSYSDFLFWYVQYKNKELELLLKSSLDNQKVTSRGFEATHISSDSSFHLQKSSVQTSDSAVYYCALSDTVREATGGAEHKPKGTDGVRLWAALQSSILEAQS